MLSNSHVAYYKYFRSNLEKLYVIAVAIVLFSFVLDIVLHLNEFAKETNILIIFTIFLISLSFFLSHKKIISYQNSYAFIVSITIVTNFAVVLLSLSGIEDIHYQIYRNLIDSPILILSVATISGGQFALVVGIILSVFIPTAFVFTGTHEFLELPLYAGALMFTTTLAIVVAIKSVAKTMEKIKEQEEIISKQKLELEETNKEKDNIFSIISHDLKGPVGLTKEALEFWGNKDLDKKDRTELVELLTNSTQNTYTLLTNLLTWANSNIGHIPFNPSYNNIFESTQSVVSSMKLISRQKDILIKTDISKELVAFYDLDMILTVIRNLISNAIKFTKCSGGNIIIVASKVDSNVIISVKDNGIGIEKDKVSKLFSSNEVISTLGTNNEKGSGLGLRICYNLVKLNKGNIWAKSILGKGTTISFSIPLTKNEN